MKHGRQLPARRQRQRKRQHDEGVARAEAVGQPAPLAAGQRQAGSNSSCSGRFRGVTAIARGTLPPPSWLKVMSQSVPGTSSTSATPRHATPRHANDQHRIGRQPEHQRPDHQRQQHEVADQHAMTKRRSAKASRRYSSGTWTKVAQSSSARVGHSSASSHDPRPGHKLPPPRPSRMADR